MLPTGKTAPLARPTARLTLEALEERLVPSWGGTPPASITVPTSATQVTLNGSGDANGAAAITSNEIDWYKFTANAGSTIFKAAKASGSSVDTVIGIYTSSGARVAYNDDFSGTDSQTSVTLTGGQVYYFGVTNYTGSANGNYTWNIDGPAPAAADDTYEDNDTQAAAANLGTVSSATTVNNLVMADAADWYKFTTTAAGTSTSTVSISFTHANGDLDMKLYNGAGTQLGSSEGTTNTETISLNGLAAGTYYVQVYGYNGARNPGYSLTVTPPSGGGGGGGGTTNAWTVMVYVTASSLYQFADADVNEMEKAASQLGSNVKIAVFWDQSSASGTSRYSTGNGSQAAWGTAGQAILTGDTNMSQVATTFSIVGEKDTGNPATLSTFMTWAATNAPATNYALILWNHGAGTYGSNFDDSDGGTMDYLTNAEVSQALATTGVPQVKVFAFDACLMAMAEVGYGLRNNTQVFCGSEELEDGPGHDYVTLFNTLTSNPGAVTPEQLGSGFVTSFGNQYVGTGTNSDTYSAARTSGYDALATALKTFTDATVGASSSIRTAFGTCRNNAVQYDGTDYVDFRDLGSFMRNVANNASMTTTIKNAANGVLTALSNLIISKTNDRRGSSGVAIYLPLNTMDSGYRTTYAAWDTATGWGSFCNWLVTGSRAPAAGDGGTGSARAAHPAHRLGEVTATPAGAGRTGAGLALAGTAAAKPTLYLRGSQGIAAEATARLGQAVSGQDTVRGVAKPMVYQFTGGRIGKQTSARQNAPAAAGAAGGVLSAWGSVAGDVGRQLAGAFGASALGAGDDLGGLSLNV